MYPHGSHAHRDRPLVASGPSAAMADSLSSISIFPFALILSLSLSFLLLLSCFFSLLHTEREENPLGIASSSSVGT